MPHAGHEPHVQPGASQVGNLQRQSDRAGQPFADVDMDLGKPDAKLMGSGAHVPWSDVWLGIGTDVEARAWAFIPRHDSDEGGFAFARDRAAAQFGGGDDWE